MKFDMKMKHEAEKEQMEKDFQRRRDMMLERRMDSKLRHDRERSFAQRQYEADYMRRQRASDERQAAKYRKFRYDQLRRHMESQRSDEKKGQAADSMRRQKVKYDNLFD